jgi:hypothetical protein
MKNHLPLIVATALILAAVGSATAVLHHQAAIANSQADKAFLQLWMLSKGQEDQLRAVQQKLGIVRGRQLEEARSR